MNPRNRQIADLLLGGGVIAYPTEGVFGLGCLPDDRRAVLRLLAIKQRDPAKGLILIAANREQLEGWVAPGVENRLPDPVAGQPVTWIVPPGPMAHSLLTGAHPGVAVRLTTNPAAAELCRLVDMPLVSTSANFSGRPTARNSYVLNRMFRGIVDGIVDGRCGPTSGASEIRVLESDKIIRKGSS